MAAARQRGRGARRVIPRDWIQAWRPHAPWSEDNQVEQDLVLSRALVDLFSDERIAGSYALRGGTALHKLILGRSLRYSEDIDLVQCVAGPTRPLFDALHERLDPWLGSHSYNHRENGVRVVYRFESESEPVQRMKLKVEANTREHFALFGLPTRHLAVANPWFTGAVDVPTFELDELLGTKLRALYQRKKGRDLFDMHVGGTESSADLDRVVFAFGEYIGRQGLHVSTSEFASNLRSKRNDHHFRGDISRLLAPGVTHDVQAAADWVETEVLSRMP